MPARFRHRGNDSDEEEAKSPAGSYGAKIGALSNVEEIESDRELSRSFAVPVSSTRGVRAWI